MILTWIWVLWLCKNHLFFDRVQTRMASSVVEVQRIASSSAFLIKGIFYSNASELAMMRFFNVKPRFIGVVRGMEVYCVMPPPTWTKLNID